MGFISFVGRVLFASVFILSSWQQFMESGVDGGPAAKSLGSKFGVFSKHVSTHTGLQAPSIEMKYAVAAAIAMKSVGGFLFIFGSSLGAYLLVHIYVPVLRTAILTNVIKLMLYFFLVQLLHQAIFTPILDDFYNYDPSKKEFNQLFAEFTRNLALFGALIFYIGMNKKNIVISRGEHKKKAPKPKTV